MNPYFDRDGNFQITNCMCFAIRERDKPYWLLTIHVGLEVVYTRAVIDDFGTLVPIAAHTLALAFICGAATRDGTLQRSGHGCRRMPLAIARLAWCIKTTAPVRP
jgi:hypothetical protein